MMTIRNVNAQISWDGTGNYPWAGQALGKAWYIDGGNKDYSHYDECHGKGVNISIRTDPSDGYSVIVPEARVDAMLKSLRANPTVIKITVDGKDVLAQEDSEELKAFKKKVFEVAKRTKRDEGWCDTGFKDAMKELGIEVPSSKVRVVLELDFNDHDTELTGDAMRGDVEAFLRYDIDQAELNVKSVEPIKD